MHKSKIGQYLDGLLQELRLKATPAFSQWDAEAIHDSRVCTRRLGAAMKLLAPLLSGNDHERFSGLMKRLRRRLGPLRDLDVMIDHARGIKTTAFPLALPWTIQQLEARRNELRSEVSGRTKPLRDLAPWVGWWNDTPELDAKAERLLLEHIPGLLASFDKQARALLEGRVTPPVGAVLPPGEKPGSPDTLATGNAANNQQNPPSLDPGIGNSGLTTNRHPERIREGSGHEVQSQMLRGYAQHDNCFEANTSQLSQIPARSAPLDPHALRIVGKELRYSLELARAGGFALPGRVFKTFKQLQDSLGLWHDFVVLSETILKLAVDAELAGHNVGLFGQILKLAQWVWRSADRHLSAFLRHWHERGPALCEQLNRLLSPVQDAPTITQTDAGPEATIP